MLSDAEIAALDDVMYPRNLDDTKFEQERPAMARRVGGRSAPARVFVSHTSELADFPAGRSFVQAVLDAVARVGMAPVDMRYFAAREGQPAPYCRRRVRGCDIYVALVGFRYGSLVPGEAIAYTEVEFLEATVAGLPRLVFLLDESPVLPTELVDPARATVDAFRQRLLDADLIVARFTTADALELRVSRPSPNWPKTTQPA